MPSASVSREVASRESAPACRVEDCCAKLLALACRAQAYATQAQGFFNGCYNQRIQDLVHKSLDCAITMVQNSTVQCRACMRHVYKCICDSIQLKQ